LNGYKDLDDSRLRTIYVALTRAKKNLYILYNGKFFDNIKVNNLHQYQDNTDYPKSDKLLLSLSHKDVWLSHFGNNQQEISNFCSGQALTVSNNTLFCGSKQIAKFSREFSEQIEKLQENGYVPSHATIRHIVWWKCDDMDKEIKIVLPNVEFKRVKPQTVSK